MVGALLVTLALDRKSERGDPQDKYANHNDELWVQLEILP